MDLAQCRIGVIGLGYVGLPLAIALGKRFDVVGYDIDATRIAELQAGVDRTLEVSQAALRQADRLHYAHEVEALRDCNVYIVSVPTPIDAKQQPDLTPLQRASEMVGKLLGPNDVVVYESTVYPGATEEICVPLLAEHSGLVFNQDFFVGYSPERINPGDQTHRLENIVKVTSGSTPKTARFVDELYQTIVEAGTHLASSIKVAEAAKIIENTQRDVNIALINELALIFDRLGLDTLEVLEAAGTKWNFLPFRPGLVGGHCIGVDPYYLTHKAQQVGYDPDMILAGRRINDGMGSAIVAQVAALMSEKSIPAAGARVLIMGLTFKENCPDVRNTRVVDMVRSFTQQGMQPAVYDPWVKAEAIMGRDSFKDIDLIDQPETDSYDALVLTVGHKDFIELGATAIKRWGKRKHVLYDVKSVLPKQDVDGRL